MDSTKFNKYRLEADESVSRIFRGMSPEVVGNENVSGRRFRADAFLSEFHSLQASRHSERHHFDAENGWVILEDCSRYTTLNASSVIIEKIIMEMFCADNLNNASVA